MEWNGTELSGTEQNGTERNRIELGSIFQKQSLIFPDLKQICQTKTLPCFLKICRDITKI